MTFRRFPRIVYLWLVVAIVAAALFAVSPSAQGSVAVCPDLIPQISLSAANPVVGQALDVEITVRNQGDATAGFYRVYLYIDPADAPPTATTRDTTYYGYPGLVAGISQSWAYTNYQFATGGVHTLYAWVDRDNQVAGECDETNNLVSMTVCVGDQNCTGPDPYETGSGDNSCAVAPTIPVDGTVQRHNLLPVGDVDWVKFSGVAGTQYNIVAGNVGDDADMVLELYSECNDPPDQTQDPTLGRGALLSAVLDKTGTFYVKLTHHDSTYGDRNGYDLSVTALCAADAFEPDNACNLARELVPGTAAQAHSFCDAGDKDWVSLWAEAGTRYTISTQNWESNSQPVMNLYPACTGTSSHSSGPRSPLTWTASRSGPVYLQVGNQNPSVHGMGTGYQLVVTKSSGGRDAYEPDDTPESAVAIQPNGVEQAHTFDTPGDQDWVAFNAVARNSYRIETYDLAPSVDTVLCLYSVDTSKPLVCDDDSGAGDGSRLLWQAPATGRYSVKIRHFSPDVGGSEASYKVRVLTTSSLCDGDMWEPDDQAETAPLLALNSGGQPHTFCAGHDQDWVRLSIPSSGIYEIRADATGQDADPVLELYASDGTTRLFQNDDYTNGLSSRILWPFVQGGTYYVRARAFDNWPAGVGTEYTLSLTRSNQSPTPLPTSTPQPTPTYTQTPMPTATFTPTPPPEATPTPSTPFETLIITNRSRLVALYGQSEADQTLAKLEQLAQNTAALGLVLRVDESYPVQVAYQAWLADTASIDKANRVADAIRSQILAFAQSYPSLRFLVVAGDDRVIPFRRVSYDLPNNEAAYRDLSPNTTVGQALSQGYSLTDDFYAALHSKQINGRPLYLPDLAVGRLVETPDEIRSTVDLFLAGQSLRRNTSAVIANGQQTYGGVAYCRTLKLWMYNNVNCDRIGSLWSHFGFSEVHLWPNPSYDITFLNLYGTHWKELMVTGDPAQVTATDIRNASNGFQRSLVVLSASYGGLNVPPENPYALDLAQTYVQKGAVFIGNSGITYGMSDNTVGLNDRLYDRFAASLFETQTVGDAWRLAKLHYVQESAFLNEYDRKILHVATFYGLPMYLLPPTLGDVEEFPGVLLDGTKEDLTFGTDLVTGTLTLRLPDSYEGLVQVETDSGAYYTLNDHAIWSPGEAGQPLFYADLSKTAPGLLGDARGLIWTGGVYTDVIGFSPLIPGASTQDETLTAAETTVKDTYGSGGWSWAIPGKLDATGRRMALQLGQFNDETNVQRVYSRLSVELVFSDLEDTAAPAVRHVAAQGGIGTAAVKIEADDPSGIWRVVVLYTTGDGHWSQMDLTFDPEMQKWVGQIPTGRTVEWLAQVIDGAGNVSYVTKKGAPFRLDQLSELIFLPSITR